MLQALVLYLQWCWVQWPNAHCWPSLLAEHKWTPTSSCPPYWRLLWEHLQRSGASGIQCGQLCGVRQCRRTFRLELSVSDCDWRSTSSSKVNDVKTVEAREGKTFTWPQWSALNNSSLVLLKRKKVYLRLLTSFAWTAVNLNIYLVRSKSSYWNPWF